MLTQKLALVTGACGDIGAAITELFLNCGATVVASDLVDANTAEKRFEKVRAMARGELFYRPADVTNRGQMKELVEVAVQKHGRLDICIANAGVVTPALFLETSEEDWLSQLNVNLNGCFHVGQAAAAAMIEKAGGRIVFIGSWVQDVPSRGLTAYCVSKGGLKMLARCMALELARYRINVNLVAPGYVDAGLSGRLFKQDPKLRDQCSKVTPLGYIMSAGQVAEAVLFLCSPGSDYMTGSTLLIDGGNSLFPLDWQSESTDAGKGRVDEDG
jgi:NAD(P)-dependent dehydrogenase (short-subunit alcohol dehydrogenase family)